MNSLYVITRQYTNYHLIHLRIMTNRTQEIRFQELIKDIKKHPYKEELLALMNEQITEDTYKLKTV